MMKRLADPKLEFNILKKRVDIQVSLLSAVITLIARKDDIYTISYEEARLLLPFLWSSTGAKYIYTVKEDENGHLVYVVDGLDMTDGEYCCPGTLLEEEYRESSSWGKSIFSFFFSYTL